MGEWNPKHHSSNLKNFCDSNGIRLQAWSPLGGASGSVLSDDVVKKVAATHNVSTAQVALRWSLQQGVAVVVGTANPDHQASDMAAFGFDLSAEEMEQLSAMQSPTLRQP